MATSYPSGEKSSELRVICVVDDDPSVRTAIVRLLRSVGLKGEGFASADDYLASGYTHTAACLILDIRMKGMNGLELQAVLAASGCRVPIIFISAHADAAARARAIEAGALDVLSKPFSEDVLLTLLRDAVGVVK